MKFKTYRLHYDTEVFDVDAFLEAYEWLDEGFDEDELASHDCFREDSLCVGVIVVNVPEGDEEVEAQVSMRRPESPNAPDWYGPDEALLVGRELRRMIRDDGNGGIEILPPHDPCLDLEEGDIVRACSFSEATLMAMGEDA